MPLYSATCPLPKNQMLRRHRTTFSPSDLTNLSLWLKADAGVTSTASSYNYKSNIALSSAGQTSINGNYTPSSTPQENANYTLFGSNNNQIEVRPNSSPVYRLYNTDNYVDGGPSYYDFTSTNGTTWSFGDGKRPISITISGLTGASAVANGAYGPFEWTVDYPDIYWLAFNSTELGGLKVYQNGTCELLANISSTFTLVATGSNWGIGSFTIVSPATGSPTGSGTIYPTGGVPTGVVTTTTVNLSNVTTWADQSGNNNNAITPTIAPTFIASSINSKPAISFNGDGSWLQVPQNIIGNEGNISIFVVLNYVSGLVIFNKGDAATYEETVWEITTSNGFGFVDDIEADAFWNVVPISIATNTPLLLEAFSSEGASQVAFNGTNSGNPCDPNNSFNDISQYIGIGGGGTDGTNQENPLNARIAEIIIYNREVSTPERQQVEAYLNAKYAIY